MAQNVWSSEDDETASRVHCRLKMARQRPLMHERRLNLTTSVTRDTLYRKSLPQVRVGGCPRHAESRKAVLKIFASMRELPLRPMNSPHSAPLAILDRDSLH